MLRRPGVRLVALSLLTVLVLLPGACVHGDALVVDDDGSDRATASERWPAAAWLPLQGPLFQHALTVVVLVEGRPVIATLDTGATTTTMSSRVASSLGLAGRVAESGERNAFTDAHGARGESVNIKAALALGPAWREDQGIGVFSSNNPDDDTFLIGLDVLQDYEIFIVADQGLVGLFPPGTAPHFDGEVVIPLESTGNSLNLIASASGSSGQADAPLIVDTGASGTTFPSAPALMAGVAADLRFTGMTRGVVSVQEQRGRFRLAPLRVAGRDVGDVAAWEDITNGGNGPGLLGLDVLMRFRTVIWPKAAQMRFSPLPDRAAQREGPGGKRCPGGCVSASVAASPPGSGDFISNTNRDIRSLIDRMAEAQLRGDDESGQRTSTGGENEDVYGRGERSDGACLNVSISADHEGRAVELAVTDVGAAPGGLLLGNALTVIVNMPRGKGYSGCLPLPPATEALGLTAATPLSVRFMRSGAAVVGSCPGRACVYWSGP